MKKPAEKTRSKINTNMRSGRSFGDLENIELNKKGILKALIPIIGVGIIILFTFFK